MSDQIDEVDASEAIRDGAVEVAEGVAQMARGFSGLALSGAFVIGVGLGGVLGFVFCRHQLETKYNQLADDAAEEIAEMRQHYNGKIVALENAVDKPKLDEIVREQGYSVDEMTTAPPMAVTPPTAVVEAARDIAEVEDDMAGEPPDDEDEIEPEVRNVFREAQIEDHWDWHKEKSHRSPLRPYIIHREERDDQGAYDSVTFTYYEADDVLCNERDEVIPEEDRERIIGEAHLEKFGHGSDDPSVVYIRNPQLEMDCEVVRSPNSYAEEVHGFQHSDPTHRRRERTSFDDE